ncbi:hypothetical protein [Parafilimonas sp.]|uniref:hypothetical protein n=1 Tax=Parafilimonas sp. TaxID=1969739 RepID=UPI0039E703E0
MNTCKMALGCLCMAFLLAACHSSKKLQKDAEKDNSGNQAQKSDMARQGNFPPGEPPGPPPGGGQGQPPKGMPPGKGPGGGMPPGGMGSSFDTSLIKAALVVQNGAQSKSGETIKADGENHSAIVTYNQAQLTLDGDTIITSGNTSSNDQSSFQGLNAAVLGRGESVIRMKGNSVKTTGAGANAIFAYGKSIIYSADDVIDCSAGGAHGLMASGGGTIEARNVNIITRGANSGAVATDRGSGKITVTGGTIKAMGPDAPGIYSTGKITVSDADITATGAEVAVIEGSNSIIANNSRLLCSFRNKCGVMIYQSFSGDAEGVDGHFEMNGGSLNCSDEQGPLFFVTNSNANIFLRGVSIHAASGILVKAESGRWGQSGSNGGKANINADKQELTGDLQADKNSLIRLSLKNHSRLLGHINANRDAQLVSVEIDATSSWELTKDSYVTTIKAIVSGDKVVNITGNGHSVYYDPKQNALLGNKKYTLENGGYLIPY